MDYFAGLDISMDETHVCVLDREGVVIYESKTASTAQSIATELAKAPSCRRIVFETGRMAPILFHGLSQLGLPVVCVESRQAYQALKSLATHKTDRNDARGLAHLARTGFFKPVHVKSLSAHALRSLIIARKKLVGQRVTLENQIRGLAVVFGIRLPRALTRRLRRPGSEGKRGDRWPLCRHEGPDCGANRRDDGGRSDRRGHEADGESLAGLQPADDNPRRGPVDRARLCGRDRRSFPHPPVARCRGLSRLGPQAVSVRGGRLCRQHLEMRGPTCANPPVRGRQCHVDALQGPAQAQGLGLRDRQAINDAQSASRSGSPPRNHHARNAARRDRVRNRPSPRNRQDRRPNLTPKRSDAQGGSRRRRGLRSTRPTAGRLRFQPSSVAQRF